jgi:predicted Zn-dependent protease
MIKVSGFFSCMNNSTGSFFGIIFICIICFGCASPQYSLHPTPSPNESQSVQEFERAISATQAKELEQNGSRQINPSEKLFGFNIQSIVDKLSRKTERPYLNYRIFLLQDADPNAVALPDGRIYLTTGLLNYLSSRQSKPGELAFIVSHEMAHTCAQHLLKRYEQIKRQQMMLQVVAVGSSVITQKTGSSAQGLGNLANDAASLISQTIMSGYSQEDELESDQLGIQYCIKAGFDPNDALYLLQDFERFESPWPFLRSHPYIVRRRQDLQKFLLEKGYTNSKNQINVKTQLYSTPKQTTYSSEHKKSLLEAQKLYPQGSTSWKNIQKQIEKLN